MIPATSVLQVSVVLQTPLKFWKKESVEDKDKWFSELPGGFKVSLTLFLTLQASRILHDE